MKHHLLLCLLSTMTFSLFSMDFQSRMRHEKLNQNCSKVLKKTGWLKKLQIDNQSNANLTIQCSFKMKHGTSKIIKGYEIESPRNKRSKTSVRLPQSLLARTIVAIKIGTRSIQRTMHDNNKPFKITVTSDAITFHRDEPIIEA